MPPRGEAQKMCFEFSRRKPASSPPQKKKKTLFKQEQTLLKDLRHL